MQNVTKQMFLITKRLEVTCDGLASHPGGRAPCDWNIIILNALALYFAHLFLTVDYFLRLTIFVYTLYLLNSTVNERMLTVVPA